MKLTKSQLHTGGDDVLRKGWTNRFFHDMIDSLWREPFINRTSGFDIAGGSDSDITWNNGTRLLELSPKVNRFAFWQYIVNISFFKRTEPLTIEIPNQEGLYLVYIFRDETDKTRRTQKLFAIHNPTEAETREIYLSKVIVAHLYWDALAGEVLHLGDDRHGSEWNPQMHLYLRQAFGARRKSGLQFTGYSLNGDGSQNAHAKFSITAGVMLHDDFELQIPASSESLPIMYCLGGVPRFLLNSGYAIASGGLVYFNAGQNNIQQATSGSFVMYHIFATNEILTPLRKIISVMGIAQYGTLADAFKGIDAELDSIYTYMPQQGRCYLGSIVIHTDIAFTNYMKARIVTILDQINHPPVSIADDSKEYLAINDKQELSLLVENLPGGDPGISTVATDLSVQGDGSVENPVVLVGDVDTPGNLKYYGTNASGLKGYHAFTATLLVDKDFEFCVVGGIAQTETLDLYASTAFAIDKLIAECDGTLNNVTIKIGANAVTGINAVSVGTLAVFPATAGNSVAAGQKITIEIGTGYSGTPTIIRGKLIYKA